MSMRALSSAQGRRSKRHYVPDDQFVALCGFLPGLGGVWRKPSRTARICINCHRLHHQQGIENAKALHQ